MNTDEHGWVGKWIPVCPWVRRNTFLKLIGVHLCSSVVPTLFGLLIAMPVALAHGPDVAKGVGFEQHPGAQLPRDDAFVDDRGRRVTFGQALGAKPAVLVLGYLACKDLCPTTLAGVTRALDASGLAPGRDYRALFVSIDPRETVAMLSREKGARIGAGDRAAWTFLRGDSGSVAKLARAVGFRYRYEPGRDAFAHAAGFAVLTPQGAISRYFLGVSFDPASLASALREARGEGIAPPASPLLLLCYHFDPTTGRYTLTILGILRAVIAAMFLLGGAWWLWRRRRP
jgi:protein SCO1/2